MRRNGWRKNFQGRIIKPSPPISKKGGKPHTRPLSKQRGELKDGLKNYKTRNMKPLHYLTLVLLILALIIALVPQNTTRPYKLTAEQLLSEIRTGTQFVSPDEVADKIVQKDPSIQLIDVRNPREFDMFSLPGAINIPLQDILSENNFDILNQGTRMNILYSNGSTEANEAWLLTRQLGYQNNCLLYTSPSPRDGLLSRMPSSA